MEGLDALLAVMYYVVTVVSLSLLCFIPMSYSSNNILIWFRFQKSKHVVKRVDPEMDGEYCTPLIGNSCLKSMRQTFYIHAGFPQEQSPITNKWFSSKSSKKVILVLSS
jgi:hypothetical protein